VEKAGASEAADGRQEGPEEEHSNEMRRPPRPGPGPPQPGHGRERGASVTARKKALRQYRRGKLTVRARQQSLSEAQRRRSNEEYRARLRAAQDAGRGAGRPWPIDP
jgi:hypothetical protein